MGFRSSVKNNVPKVDLQSYNVLIAGGFKSGKTRLWKEVIERHFPNQPEAGLLLAFEDGYNTWEIDSFIDVHNRDWDFFKNEVVKGLVEESKNGGITKVIGIDTCDRMLDMAGEWLIQKWNKKYAKSYTSIQEFNENIKDENIYTELKKEVWRQIDTLKMAGYGFFWLAWTKEKETTTIDGLKFNSIELMMSKTGKDIFHSQAHLVCCLYNEVKVLDKEGNILKENEKRKNKDVASNFHSTETNMYFRENNYINIAGGRFTDLPEKVLYGADNFLQVFENAVNGQLKKTTQTVEELRETQAKVRNEKAREYAESKESEYSVADLHIKITTKAQTLTDDNRKIFIPKIKEIVGFNDYRKSDDIAKLENLYKELETLTQ